VSDIALLYLAEPRFGGWVTYTAHLARALEAAGYTPRLFQIGNRDESRARPYGQGLNYFNISPASAFIMARSVPTLITAVDKAGLAGALPVLSAGAGLVVHDPTEMKHKGLLEAAKNRRVVTVRRANVSNLAALGVQATYVPHPFKTPTPVAPKDRVWHAVSYSRLDWDKHTLIIAQANEKLPAEQRVWIYGAENRMYTHHKLDTAVPGWRENYHGRFSSDWHAAGGLAARSKFVVDLSVIKGDGGGTQYTFLEAWSAGAHLIVNRGWLREDDKTLEDGRNCTAVGSAEELVEQLSTRREPDANVVEAGRLSLLNHSPKAVAEALAQALGWAPAPGLSSALASE
jgi:hypothetical protein